MTSPHYDTGSAWTDGYNMAILGKTQTGKTSTARELHAESPRVSVWLNEDGVDRVDGVAGKVVHDVEGVRQAFLENQYAINLVSSDRERDIADLHAFMWDVADRSDRQLPMQVIVDEVHRVAPQSNEKYGNFPSRDAVRRYAKEGVKRNIKFVGITQDPTAYDKQTLRQTEWRLVFDMTAENRKSSVVRKMGFNWSEIDASDRYTGVLHNATGDVVDARVKAQARYA